MSGELLGAVAAILAPHVFIYLVAGVVLGLIVGALPGLTATMAMIILLPVTYSLPTLESIQILMGVFIAGITAGSITAIAIGIPGTPASAATVLDGHKLTLMGRSGEAICLMFLLNLIGNLLGAVVCILIAPQLATFALKFGPPEYALLALIGMSLVISLSSKSLLKGLTSGAIGMAVALVGVDPMTGGARFNMGVADLAGGIGYGAVMIGLFGLAEVVSAFGAKQSDAVIASRKADVESASLTHLRRAAAHLWPLRWTILRSAPIGIFIGALPGLGSDIAAWLGYDMSKRFSKKPEAFGTGSVEGLAGCEVAKSAEDGGAIIPTVTFGIPGDSQTVVILGALMLHGVRPGPLLFEQQSLVVWSIFAALLVAPFVTAVLGLLTVRPTVWLVEPSHPLPVSGRRVVLHRRCIRLQQHSLRRLDDACLRSARIWHEAYRLPGRSPGVDLHPHAADGIGVPARTHAGSQRSVRVLHAAGLRHPLDRRCACIRQRQQRVLSRRRQAARHPRQGREVTVMNSGADGRAALSAC